MYGLVKLHFEHILQSDAQLIIELWPVASRRLAHNLIQKYGMPHEATPTMLFWNFNGFWKRTVLHKDGTPHNFPHPHVDLLEQTVDTKIPSSKHDEISTFDGSIIIDRTRGEMTAYCENEQANTLILNLAHDIAIGKKTAEEAREYMNRSAGRLHKSWPNPYKESLQFTSTILSNNPDMVTAEPN